jgi:acyl-CoA dehydrogenase
MFLITAALKRYAVEGRLKSDAVFLEVAVEDAFEKIDIAFRGILTNLSSGLLGVPFRVYGYYARLNPMGATPKDKSLHDIATLLSEDDAIRERICNNIYKSTRIEQLLDASHTMQENKALLQREKNNDRLTSGEVVELAKIKAIQHEIITVDSFTHEAYQTRNTKS